MLRALPIAVSGFGHAQHAARMRRVVTAADDMLGVLLDTIG